MDKQIVILGNGVASQILRALMPPDIKYTNIYTYSKQSFEIGLRYIHPPKQGSVLHQWIADHFSPAAANNTTQLNWGYVFPDCRLEIPHVSRFFWPAAMAMQYAQHNWRDCKDPNIMNGLRKGNTKPKRLGLDYGHFMQSLYMHSYAPVNCKFVEGKIKSILTDSKVIHMEDGRTVLYDVLINTIPAKAFTRMIDSDHKFEFNPATYLSIGVGFLTNLDYVYNAYKPDPDANVCVSRVTFKQNTTDFELSFAPNTKPEFEELIQACDPLLNMFMTMFAVHHIDDNWKDSARCIVNEFAHFNHDENMIQSLLGMETFSIFNLGRYAQHDHSVKLEEMFERANYVINKIVK